MTLGPVKKKITLKHLRVKQSFTSVKVLTAWPPHSCRNTVEEPVLTLTVFNKKSWEFFFASCGWF
jgi:hypothetical protein